MATEQTSIAEAIAQSATEAARMAVQSMAVAGAENSYEITQIQMGSRR